MDGVDEMDKWPVWVRVVAQVGAPIVVAAYLLVGLTHDVKAEVKGMREDLQVHTQMTTAAISRRDASDVTELGYMREQNRLSMVNCVHGSHSKQEIAECIGSKQ